MVSKAKPIIFIVCALIPFLIYSHWFLPKFRSGECGARSLFSVLYEMGDRRSEESVKSYFRGDQTDTSMEEIVNVANRLGFTTRAAKMSTGQLRAQRPLGVLHIDEHHFVGLVGYDSQAFHIAETGYEGPLRRERWTDGDLMARWDGVILVISKPEKGTISRAVKPTPSGDIHGKPN